MIPKPATGLRRARMVRRQALTIGLLVSGYAGYYFCRSNLSVTIPLLIADLARRGMAPDAARVMLGSMASFGVLAYAIGKFPSGGLADFLGGRRNFLFGMAGSIAFTVLFAFSGALPIFTLAWMGNRLVQSLGWAGMVNIASKWFSFRRYGTVMAIISLSYLFGDALARQFMALLIEHGLGWRGVFLSTAAVLGALLIASLFLLRESPADIGEPEPPANPFNLFTNLNDGEKQKSLRALLSPFLSSGVFWLACGLSLGTTILRETFGLWTPTYFAQSAGMSVAEAAAKSALFPLAGGVSVILCGWMSDRLGRGGRAGVLLGGLLLSAVALLALGLGAAAGSTFRPVALVAIIAFLIIGPYSFLGGAIALDFGGKQGSGTASGIIDGVGYLGGVLSGDSMARISIAYGWNGAFLVLAGVAAIRALPLPFSCSTKGG
ncbi:MAG: MFS transporter [Bryobacterales bacterium]|nr:MFS transporter [Bryobacterales bacterium]MBV9398415.1 MFS transporter [Bryobacterales bacterium]